MIIIRKQEKLDNMKKLSDDIFSKIISSKNNFREFLDFQTKLYKYDFKDTLLIYGQNPNAVACATFDEWNKIGRRIHRGRSSMQVFTDETQSEIKHLFELNDTYGKRFNYPLQFSISEKYKDNLIQSFETQVFSNDFDKNFKWCVEKYVEDNFEKFMQDCFIDKSNSLFDEIPQEYMEKQFKDTLMDSVGWITCKKFGIPKGTYETEKAFENLSSFATKEMLFHLGNATQYISKATIDHVNQIIKEERKIENEREKNVNSRGNWVREPDLRGSVGAYERGQTNEFGEIRQPVQNIHGGRIPIEEEFSNFRGDMGQDLSGSRRGINQSNDGTEGAILPQTRETEEGIYEDIPIRDGIADLGRGNSSERDSVQTSLDNNEDLGEPNGSPFFTQKSNELFLEYKNMSHEIANSFLNDQLFLKATESEIHTRLWLATNKIINKYENVFSAETVNEITNSYEWAEISHQIHDDLIGSDKEKFLRYRDELGLGKYTTPFVVIEHSESPQFDDREALSFEEADFKFKEVEKAEFQERIKAGTTGGYHKTWGTIYYMENDYDHELSSFEFRYDIGNQFNRNSGLYMLLKNSFEYENFALKHGRETSFTPETINNITNILLPILEPYSHKNPPLSNKEYLKEIILFGSGFENGKERIYDFFNDVAKSQIAYTDFLRKEYGMGGHSHTFLNGDDGFTTHGYDGIGIELYNANEKIKYNWNQVASLIDELIKSNEYYKPPTPKPFFFENFADIKNSLDMAKYEDGDTIGYNKDGVKYSVGKFDSNIFINTETSIHPSGEVLGNRDIPQDILRQINAYRNAEQNHEKKNLDKTVGSSESELLAHATEEEEFWNDIIETPKPVKNEENTDSTVKVDLENATNFSITDKADIGLASGKTKFNQNIAAVKLLQEIEKENRIATPEEQQTIAKYSGFGGIPQAFDPNNTSWQLEYIELKELLSDKEYDLARASTLNAHYTSTTVIEAMYNGLDRLGFKGGNILEPSMGVGNFFGMLPENLRNNSRLYGVELDETTGKLAKQLYPNSNIQITGFENASLQDNFFDVAIGNVPFGNYKVNDPKFDKQNFLIHDYFIAKSIDKVKPHGIIAYITSKGTMDKENTSVRKYLAERAELLGAIRLPNNAFKESANTEVTSDILFLKKRDKLVDATDIDWVYTGYHKNGNFDENGEPEKIAINQYFVDNPEMMLGKMVLETGMYGVEPTLKPFTNEDLVISKVDNFKRNFEEIKETNNFNEEQLYWINEYEKTAISTGVLNANTFIEDDSSYFNKFGYGSFQSISKIFYSNLRNILTEANKQAEAVSVDLKELLNNAISNLPENIVSNFATLEELEETKEKTIPADPTVKNFCHVVVDGEIYQRENSIMKVIDLPKTTIDRVKGLIEIRDTTREMLDLQLNNCSDDALAEAQLKLNNQYDNFFKKYGAINSGYNQRIFGSDADFPLLSSIEELGEENEVVKADMFSKRTVSPVKAIENVETSVEALAVSLNEFGGINIEYMANLANKSNDEIIEDLQGIIFKDPLQDSLSREFDPLGNWLTADEYLSGEVVEKLAIAGKAAIDNPIYAKNVEALKSVQPTPLEAHEINVRLGSSWINPNYYKQFMFETLKPMSYEKNSANVNYSNITGTWFITDKPYSRHNSVEARERFGTKRMDAYELMENMLNQKSPKIYDVTKEDNGNEKRVLNKPETIAIKDKQNLLKQEFNNWIFKDPQRRETLTLLYNKLFNSTRERQYDGSHLTFPAMNPAITLKQHQLNGVSRVIFGGNTLLAHVVGAGKTFTMAAASMEMKRLGLAKKPCIVVPNHLVNQWANEFKRLYPTSNILAATKKDFEKKKRQRFCGRIATGEWDAVIIGHSSFEKIPVSKERQEKKLEKDIEMAKDGLAQIKQDRGERILIKELERNIKSLEFKLKQLNSSPKDDLVNFEHLGIDALFLDEAHMFKNKFMFTKMTNVAGLSRSAAQKSSDMEMKCDYINEINGSERGVIFATGTPVSNSMVEMYTMQTYLQKQELQRLGLNFFDNWASNFGETVSSLELAPSGQGFRLRDRFAKFVNLPELMGLYRKVADIQTSDMLNLDVPELKTGKPITISVDPSPAQKEFVKFLVDMSEQISSGHVSAEVYNMLCVTNDGRLGALDIRCLDLNKLSALTGVPLFKLDKSDYEFSKVNACVNNVFDIYKRTESDNLLK